MAGMMQNGYRNKNLELEEIVGHKYPPKIFKTLNRACQLSRSYYLYLDFKEMGERMLMSQEHVWLQLYPEAGDHLSRGPISCRYGLYEYRGHHP